MSDALVRAALSRRHSGTEQEGSTLEYGGDERRPVEPLDDEDDIRAKQLLNQYGAIVEQLQREDPEQLQPHHAIIVNLLAKDPTQPFTPSELAGLYVAFNKMEYEYRDDNSAVSKIRGYGRLPIPQRASDPREQERQQNIEDLEGLREEIFWHLTGFQETRPELEMPEDPDIPNGMFHRIFFSGRIQRMEADHEAEIRRVERAREDFYRDNQDMFTMSRFMEKQGNKAFSSVLSAEITGITPDEIEKILALPSQATAEAVIARKLRASGIAAAEARRRAHEIYMSAEKKGTEMALETHFMSEMDELVEEAIAESLPTDPTSLASEISDLEKQIRADTTKKNNRSTSPAEKTMLENKIKENERRLKAARSLQKLSKPGQEKQFKDPTKKTANKIAALAGVDPSNATEYSAFTDGLGEMLGLPTGFSEADINNAMKGKDSVSFMQMLFELLFKAIS